MLRASTRRQITSGTRNRVDTGLSPLPRHDQRDHLSVSVSAFVQVFFHDAMATQRETRGHFIQRSCGAATEQQSAATRSSSQLAATRTQIPLSFPVIVYPLSPRSPARSLSRYMREWDSRQAANPARGSTAIHLDHFAGNAACGEEKKPIGNFISGN